MKLISKTHHQHISTSTAVRELQAIYDIWLNQKKFPTNNNSTYHITITHTHAKHEQDLNFILRSVFNRINRDYLSTLDHLNYIFVIEYPKIISKGEFIPTNWKPHAHIVLNTSHPIETIRDYLNSTFNNADIRIDDTTNRFDKRNFINYLTKQAKGNSFFTDKSYNYKITLL